MNFKKPNSGIEPFEYAVRYKELQEDNFRVTELDSSTSWSQTLNRYSSYTVEIYAIDDNDQEGAKYTIRPASQPTNLNIEWTTAGNTLSLTWDAPEDNGNSEISGYVVDYIIGSGDWESSEIKRTETNIREVTLEVPQGVAKVRVAALTAVGLGVWEEQDVPPQPPLLNVSPIDYDFGNIEEGTTKSKEFTVKNAGGGKLTWEVDNFESDCFTMSTKQVNPESGDGKLTISVKKDAPVGECSKTLTIKSDNQFKNIQVKANIYIPPPSAVTDVNIGLETTNDTSQIIIKVTFKPPNSGTKPFKYFLRYKASGESNFKDVKLDSATIWDSQPLNRKGAYTVEVYAEDALGQAGIKHTIRPASKPINLNIEWDTTGDGLLLSWDAPKDTGNSEISWYVVEYRTLNGDWESSEIKRTETNFRQVPLAVPHDVHKVRVAALTPVGLGVWEEQNVPPRLPVLSVNPDSYDFDTIKQGSNPSTSFTVTNTGGGTLTWKVHDNFTSDCFTVSPEPGSSQIGDGEITISVKEDAPDGSCGNSIKVDAGDAGTKNISIKVNIEGPELDVSPLAHNFGDTDQGDTPSEEFTVANTGGGTITWHVDYTKTQCFSVLPSMGISQTGDGKITVIVKSDAQLGTCKDDVKVISKDGGSTSIQIEVDVVKPSGGGGGGGGGGPSPLPPIQSTIPTPVLNVSPLSHDFGTITQSSTISARFTVTNTSSGTLAWQVGNFSSDCFTVSPSPGISQSGNGELTVTVKRDAPIGSCEGSITVNGGSAGSQSISITVNVVQPTEPILEVSPLSHDFGTVSQGDTASKKSTVTNIGIGTLTWAVDSSFTSECFTVSPSPGIPQNGNGELTVSVKSDAPTRSCSDTLIVNAGSAGSQSISIQVNVVERPVVTVKNHILFVSERDGNREIYTMNADGTNVQRLTNNEAYDYPYAWAPEDSRILFVSTRDGNSEIYTMNADGTNVQRLTDNDASDDYPLWSPDGSRILFVSTRDGNSEIYIMNADGTDVKRLTDNNVFDNNPLWSPDGRHILFESTRDGNSEIYIMNADGTDVQRLTDNDAYDYPYDWSSDGSRILFLSQRDGNREIYTMNAEGTDVQRLTNNNINDWPTAWSPDGSRISFVSTRDGNDFEIYTMNADGTDVKRLTNNDVDDRHPWWSPDGSRIAFQSETDGNTEIYTMNADGTDVKRLTNNDKHDVLPWTSPWSPPPKLKISPLAHAFGTVIQGYTTSARFTVTNSGGGTLTWKVDSNFESDCFTVSPSPGSSQSGDGEITVSVKSDAPTRSCSDSVIVDAGEEDTKNISITGNILPPPPVLEVLPLAHAFGTVIQGYTTSTRFTVRNIGGSTLTWEVDSSFASDCFTVSPSPGSSQSGDGDITVTLKSDATIGSCSDTLTVNGGSADSKSISITVNILEPPKLNVSALSHDFGTVIQGYTTYTRFTVTNSGGGTLTWKVDSNFESDCFTVSPSPGSSQSGDGEITVSVKSDAPTRSCSDSVIVDAGEEDTKNISITGNILPPPPVLEVLPLAHAFGTVIQGYTTSTRFTVRNIGGSTLTWEVDSSFASDCFTVSPSPGSSQSGDGDITVTLKSDATIGSCSDTLTVNGGSADSKSISITVNILEPPKLNVSALSHDFGTVIQGYTTYTRFTVTNAGGSTITWKVDDNFTSDCFTVSPSPGSSQTGNGALTVTVKSDASEGSCEASVTVDAGTAGQENIKIMASIKIYRILFRSNRDGDDYEIYTMNADGTDVKRLTDSRGSNPSWSPDGSRILFRSNLEIYTMKPDGTDEKRLTNNDAHDYPYAWSPDGSRILFQSHRDGDWEIYTMKADGTDVKRLTNNDKNDHSAVWSPDGSRIAFISLRDGNWEIYTMRADGTDVKRLTDNIRFDQDPSWSPDGSRILFESNREGNYEIYTMKSDGTDLKRLTDNDANDSAVALLTDGSRILFTSEPNGKDSEIYTMRADGTDVKQLTDNYVHDYAVAWSPDGSRILFTSRGEIYTMRADGTDVQRLTDNDADDRPIAWSPSPKLKVSPLVHDFGTVIQGYTTSAMFTVTNAGSGTITWEVDSNFASDCFTVSPRPGSSQSGDGDITVSVKSNAPTRSCSDSVIVDAGDEGTKNISITVNILQPPPVLKPLSHDFGTVIQGYTTSTRFTVTNAGSGTLTWEVDSNFASDCFTVLPSPGSSQSGDGDITVSVKSDAPEGSCEASVTVDTGASGQVNIKVMASIKVYRILFYSNRDGNDEIYTMKADGTDVKRLTNNDAYDNDPSWSPDGSRILFISNRRDVNSGDIYTMKSDGTDVKLLTNNFSDEHVDWSPDGSLILVASHRDGNLEIYTVKADGTDLKRLTYNHGGDIPVAWSPDGSRILFRSFRDDSWDIYTMKGDGTDVKRLTNHGAYDHPVAWSPDGSRILFESKRDGNLEIYTIKIDGTDVKRLTYNGISDEPVTWSPDGSRILFESKRDGEDREIYTMRADGTDVKRLTNNGEMDIPVAWSPDGSRILFASNRHGNYEIYTMRADGTDVQRLTNNDATDFLSRHSPWSPSPKLKVSPLTHDFGNVIQGSTTSARFTVTNAGSSTLIWKVDDKFTSDCFTVSPSPGSSQSGDGDITVSVKSDATIRSCSDSVIVNAGDEGTKNISITVNVLEPPPVLAVSPLAHDFGAVIQGYTTSTRFTVTNAGGNTLTWKVDSSFASDCFTVSPSPGSSQSGDGDITVSVKSDTTIRSCSDSVIVDAGSAGTKTIRITVITVNIRDTNFIDLLNEPGEDLCADDRPNNFVPARVVRTGSALCGGKGTTVGFGYHGDPTLERAILFTQPATIAKNQIITVTFVGWAGGHTSPQTIVGISANTTGFQTCGTLSAKGYLGNNESQTVACKSEFILTNQPLYISFTTVMDSRALVYLRSIRVQKEQLLNVSPDSHDFGTVIQGYTTSARFTVTNARGSILTWEVEDNFTSDCFTVSPSPGSSQSGDGDITVSVKRDTTIRSCSDTLTVNGGSAGSKSISITGNIVEPPPVLEVSPLTHDFGNVSQGSTTSARFTVTNAGSGTLTWKVDDNFTSDCFTVSPSPGSAQSGDGDITVSIKSDAPIRSCSDSVIVNAGDEGTKNISITVNVSEPPKLKVSSLSHDFGAVIQGYTTSARFTVRNAGGNTLTWKVDDNFTSDCFTVSPSPGSSQNGNGSLTVTVKGNAPEGSCEASVTVDAGDAGQKNIKVMASIKIYRILFYSFLDGNYEIYTMNADGTDEKRPIDSGGENPSWSPDGSRILFASYPDGNLEIYTMKPDGTDIQRLTDNDADDRPIAWSPDGSRILFVSARDGADWEIYTMQADGTDVKRLTNNDTLDVHVAWSPDGSRILFSSYPDGIQEIYTMKADGTDVQQLTDNDAADWPPAWSPDGSRILFRSNRDGNREIYTMQADGTDVKRLTNNNKNDYPVAWSPDGSRILFYSYRDGNQEIYTMKADGTDVKRLTDNDRYDWPTAWSPDGSRILFYSNRDGNREIYTMNADGTDVKRLTNNNKNDHPVAWSPPPKLKVSPLTHDFGNVNQGSTTSARFTVRNAGGSTLIWKVDDNFTSDCFTVSPSPGSAQSGDGDITVSIKSDAPIRSCSDSVIVNAGDEGTKNISIIVNVVEPPKLKVSSLAHDFGAVIQGYTTSARFTVTNAGGSTLIWKVDDNFTSDCFTVSPSPGISQNGNGALTVTVKGNAPEGSCEDSVIVDAGDAGSESIKVMASIKIYRILFVSFLNNNNYEIYTMKADGTDVKRLTNYDRTDWPYAWSPDGSRILFFSTRGGGIYTMKPDGTDVVQLFADGNYPSWSPDGSRILFYSYRDNNWEIYTMKADGTDVKRLTNNHASDKPFAWSPDGSRILFQSTRNDSNHEIYTMKADGTDVKRLTYNNVYDDDASWSPDGSHILFESNTDGDSEEEIYIMRADGTGLKRLTNNTTDDLLARMPWSPPPKLNVSPLTHDFGNVSQGSTTSARFTVTNAGSGTLTWKVDDNFTSDCFTVSPSPGISQSSDGDITVSVKSDTTIRSCSDSVIVDAGDEGSKSIRITGNIVEPPKLKVSSLAHDFGAVIQGYTTSARFTVRNAGGNTLTWKVDDNFTSDCFTVSPSPGSSQNGNGELTVTVKGNAPEGSCEASVTVDAGDAGQKNIKVMASIKIYRILFEYNRDGNHEIYTMNADGTDVQRLIDSGGENPSWSPDGSRILFESNRHGDGSEIYTMNADGTDVQFLAGGNNPSWSPDGSRILFISYHSDDYEIYTMKADGTDVKRLTDNNVSRFYNPSWSPDGNRILFISYHSDDNWEIYTVKADGTDVQQLTDNDADDWPTAWSPDGSRILFRSNRDGNWEIYTMKSDGTDLKRLTNNHASDAPFAWSPDGSRILFYSYRDGIQEIYTMKADGTDVKRLTDNDRYDWPTAWSPDGSRILFYSNRDGNREIYTMNADGTDVKRLTNNNKNDYPVAWSPPPKLNVFPLTHDFGNVSQGSTTSARFTVTNAGSSTLIWKVDDNFTSDCFTVSPSPGSSQNGDGDITVSVRSDAPIRSCSDSVIVDAGDEGTKNISITVNIVEPPKLKVSSLAHDFGAVIQGYTTSTRFTITNAGGSTLIWKVDDKFTSDCFTVSPSPGSSQNGNGDLTVTVKGNAPEGSCEASVTVDAGDAGQKNIKVMASIKIYRILFRSKRDGDDYEIYTMNADGTDVKRLTNNDKDDRLTWRSPWSP